MRNYMKMELLEMSKTLKELCNTILNECQQNNQYYAIDLLQQAQQAAITMGESIEEIEGEGTEPISVLEEFCEYIYQLSESLNTNADQLSLKKENKIMDKILLRIENGIRHIPVTYEIVFMPYKASMWDCMESIYKAAAADSDCKAFVVPIPYYDLDNKRNPSQYHYEGDSLPDDIPITSYEEYNIQQQRPDVIYIHNPFDDWNLVTRVLPEFYSHNLKKYTTKLVYVPYYSTSGYIPESQQNLPVHRNMDYMVIQSKNEQQFYNDRMFTGKLLPLGSPKYDRIISLKKQNPQVPDDWRGALDGKVKIFYNTSLSSLLDDTDAALRKMEYVFSCFEGRNDAALIWRPHPLTDATLKSMRPQYIERYQKIIQRFYDSGIGIIDRTGDMDKTIAVSDAYIGEATSSVVNVFGVSGNPLFLLNMKMDKKPTEEEFCDIWFCNVEAYKGQNWTFSAIYNALCTIDMDTGKVSIVASIPNQKLNQGWLVVQVYGYNGKIILVPHNMDSIVEYDIERKEFSFYKLPNALQYGNMLGIVPYGDDFFIVPSQYPAIIQYNAASKKYIYHKHVMDEIIKMSGDTEYDDRNYIGGGVISGDTVYWTLVRTNCILVWHMDTCKYEIVKVGDESNIYGAITEVNNGFLLRMYEGAKLLFWNPATNETKEITQFPDGFKYNLNSREEEHPFGGFLASKNHLLLTPQLGNQILEINKETLEISEYKLDWKEHIREPQSGIFDNQWSNFRSWIVPERSKAINRDYDEVSIITSCDGCMLTLNLDTHEYKEVKISADINDVKKLFAIEKLYEDFTIPISSGEDLYHSLDDFIDAVAEGRLKDCSQQQLKAYSEIAANLDGTCGEKVHKAIKKTLE